MGRSAAKRRATYADLEAVPAPYVAEIIGGELHVTPRPAPPHLFTSGELGDELRGPFQKGRGGPGGWWIFAEPELHFPDPAAPKGIEVVAPDVAGWLRERMPKLPRTAYFALAPDWVCEVLSPSTEKRDREEKMPLYARNGVRFAWLVDPLARTLELYVLGARGWREPTIYRDADRARVVPFDAIELDLAGLWAEAP